MDSIRLLDFDILAIQVVRGLDFRNMPSFYETPPSYHDSHVPPTSRCPKMSRVCWLSPDRRKQPAPSFLRDAKVSISVWAVLMYDVPVHMVNGTWQRAIY